ncbi:DUF1080 domain-containing protein, partial [Hydrotalea sp.]|uniref:3-keto-disaccharide hydrolase n=1 Tax=Hydrotalea sp. TaxID=2881279 RepID=UPI00258B1DB6
MQQKLSFHMLLLLTISLLGFIPHQTKDNTLTAKEKKQGWQLLFNGNNLGGWRTYQNKPSNSWEVQNGILHCKGSNTDKSDKRADLITDKQYDNFELSVDWKISPAGNSGIMYHVTEAYDAAYLSG